MRAILFALIFMIALFDAAQGDSFKPQPIDSLYAHADFVGFVEIIGGEQRRVEHGGWTEHAVIYHARVERAFKGGYSNLYFGPHRGLAIGNTYLVCLYHSGRTVEQRLQGLRGKGNGSFDTVQSSYYRVMFEGFGAMEAGRTSALYNGEGNRVVDAVKISSRYVILPSQLQTVAIATPEDSLTRSVWVRRDELTKYLSKLATTLPHVSRSRVSDSEYERSFAIDRVVNSYDWRTRGRDTLSPDRLAMARRYLRDRLGQNLADRLTLVQTGSIDPVRLAERNPRWKLEKSVTLVVYAAEMPDEKIEGVAVGVLMTYDGRILNREGGSSAHADSTFISPERVLSIATTFGFPLDNLSLSLDYTSRFGLVWHLCSRDEEYYPLQRNMLIDPRSGEILHVYEASGMLIEQH